MEREQTATPERRARARADGQVAYSRDVGAAVSAIVLAIAIGAIFPRLAQSALDDFRAGFDLCAGADLSVPLVVERLTSAAISIVGLVGPVALVALSLGLAASFAQVGFRLQSKKKPNFQAAAPLRMLAELTKGAAFFTLALFLLWQAKDALAQLSFLSTQGWLEELHARAGTLTTQLAAALTFIALADYAWARVRHERGLRMSTQEIRDEAKDTEANPEVRRAMRRKDRT